MTKTLENEIKELITKLDLNCTIDEFENKTKVWEYISYSQKLSEQFIEYFKYKFDWWKIYSKQKLSEEFIEKFKDFLNWGIISKHQKLSEEFIEKHQNFIDWDFISEFQKLSEQFIEKFKNYLNWYYISFCQKLSEEFIEKFKDFLNWGIISTYQKLSEQFIEKYQDKVHWLRISYFQKLSLPFIEKYKDKIYVDIQMKKHHVKIDPIKEAKEYAEKHNLKIEDGYLYAFREHDEFGRGMYNKAIFYKHGETYEDWHCDLDKTEENSFGLGIFPEGNTPVKIKLEDFGVYIPNRTDGKARVWKFTVL